MLSRRHRTAAVSTALAAAALVGLTGCEKPTPLVTLYSGDTSVKTEAMQYCESGQSAQDNTCTKYRREPPVLDVRPGDGVGVDVSRSLAADGWIVAVNGQRATELQQDHYTRIPGIPFDERGNARLDVYRVRREGENLIPRGQWQFVLRATS